MTDGIAVTTAYEIECDLWGASSNWVTSIHEGVSALVESGDRVESYFNYAYAGVQVTVYDEATMLRIASYFRRMRPLAIRKAAWPRTDANALRARQKVGRSS